MQTDHCHIALAIRPDIPRHLFPPSPDFRFHKIVDVSIDGNAVDTYLCQNPCDILMIDIFMLGMNGLQMVQQLSGEYLKTKICVITDIEDLDHVKTAFMLGAQGYVLIKDLGGFLFHALDILREGRRFLSPLVTEAMIDTYFLNDDKSRTCEEVCVLTKTEDMILHLICHGFQNKDIAEQLDVSRRTVETHRANILSKCRVKNTASLVHYALTSGLVK